MTTVSLEDLVGRLHRLEVAVRDRTPQLVHSSLDDGSLVSTVGGQLSGSYGLQWDGTTTAASLAGPAPPAPTVPVMFQIVSGIRVVWPGTFADPQPGFASPVVAPMDWANLSVQVSDTADFSGTTVTKQIVSAAGGAADFTWGRVNTPLYARMRAITQSGHPSAWSPVGGPLASGGLDVTIPNRPTALALTSTATLGTSGEHFATITATWAPPTSNTDGSAFDDFSHYLVQWWLNSVPQVHSVITRDLTTTFTVGAPGQLYTVQVAAVDQTAHQSAWSLQEQITAAVDTTPPTAPSTPQVSSYYGALRIYWDGLDNAGNPMPADFGVVEVHVSTASAFTPTPATLVSQLATSGYAYATAPYGATRYVKFVAVDNSINRSTASSQASGATVQVSDGDIASLNVGKLVAGTILGDIVVGGRFATALIGARSEMNALGFQRFDTDGITKLVSLTATEALLTGTFKTAQANRRIEIIGSTGSASVGSAQIDFYGGAGTLSAYIAGATLGGGTAEGLILSVPYSGGSAWWNAMRIDTTGLAYTDAKYVHIAFGGVPGGGGDFRLGFATDMGTPSVAPTLVDRLFIDEGVFETWFNTTGGQFAVSELNTSSGIQVARLQMYGGGGIAFTRSPGGDFLVQERAVGGGSFYDRFRISDDHNTFRYAGTSRWADIDRGPADSTTFFSPQYAMVNSQGYGAFFRYQAITAGGSGHVVLRDASDTIYEDLWASAFTVSSARAGKTGFRDLPGSAIDRLKLMKPQQYRLRAAPTPGRKTKAYEEQYRLGFIGEDVVDEVRVDSDDGPLVDLYGMVTLEAAALLEAIARIEVLEGRP